MFAKVNDMDQSDFLKYRFWAVIFSVLLTGCAQKTVFVEFKKQNSINVNSDQKIVIIPPKIIFEHIVTEERINPDAAKLKELSDIIMNTLESVIGGSNVIFSRVFKTVDNEMLFSSDKYVRSNVSETDLSYLINFCDSNSKSIVLLQYLFIKTGLGAYWNPMSGNIGGDTSSSLYRTAGFECNSKQMVWHNSVFIRGVLTVDNIVKPLQSIFRNAFISGK